MVHRRVIRGVIFDLDGVLVTTDELHYRAWKHIADREGVYFDRTINERLRGVSRMESLEILLERCDRPLTREQKAAWAHDKNEYYRGLLATMSPADVLPGVNELLADLRARGIHMAIASSSRNTPLILERTGLSDVFDAIADGNDIAHSKPHPEVFLLAAARLALAPAECVVLEDAMAGIEGARAANMPVIGIGGEKNLPGVQPVVPTLEGITAEKLLALVTE